MGYGGNAMRGRGGAGETPEHDDSGQGTRLDKWLWAARFYKTRSLAADAIVGGKVHLNGDHAKRAKNVEVGDTIRIRHGAYETTIRVTALANRRGSATEAAKLYEETPESRAARDALAVQMRSMPGAHDAGRPSKKDRREIARLRDLDG
jgi:ribosome-associated heat shock protein Hsp15